MQKLIRDKTIMLAAERMVIGEERHGGKGGGGFLGSPGE